MPISPFKLERFYALHEFNSRIMLSSSDCESLSMSELLTMAAPESKDMWETLRLGYTETQGNPALRSEIIKYYKTLNPENVMVAAPEELIFIAMQTLLKPTDHVIALAPAYQSLYEIAISIGCPVSFWKLKDGENGWHADVDELENLIKSETRLIVINIPNNPTGYLPTKDEFERIISIARKHGITVFSDEMYRMMEHNPADRLPALCDVYEKGISLSGLSKTMALPGLRMGWLAARDTSFIDECLAYKDYTTICNGAPSEVLGLIALQNGHAIIERNMEIIETNLRTALDVFTRHEDLLRWVKPRGGSIAFPEWMGKMPVEEFCENILKKHSVMLVPGSMFDHPGNHFRLGLGRKTFTEGMASLEELLQTIN
jgi:aspartate/methionine/tyrosine aminotransferase